MARPTRQTKRTPDVDRVITQAINVGASYRDAARAAGISEDTLARWRKRDAEFAAIITRAEAEGKIAWLAKIEQAGNAGDWRALAWKLERRFPAEWGKVDRLEVTVRERAAQLAAKVGTTADDLLARAERIAAEAWAE